MFFYIAGAIAGAAYGGLIGYIKYFALWRSVIKNNKKMTSGGLYQRMGISYAVNILTLFSIFMLRDVIPWDFMTVMIASAVMLSLIGKLAPMSEIANHVEEKAS